MSLTPTKSIPLGFPISNFLLPEPLTGENITMEQVRGDKGTLVVFICNHCPYVIHIIEKLTEVMNEYKKKGIGMVAISSNDVENYPDDAPDKMAEFAKKYGFDFPYLYDESQEVAIAYDAACTPDFSLFDGDDKCVYRGQFDSSRPGNDHPVTGEDLKRAMEMVLKGERIPEEGQLPSQGCNIKWK